MTLMTTTVTRMTTPYLRPVSPVVKEYTSLLTAAAATNLERKRSSITFIETSDASLRPRATISCISTRLNQHRSSCAQALQQIFSSVTPPGTDSNISHHISHHLMQYNSAHGPVLPNVSLNPAASEWAPTSTMSAGVLPRPEDAKSVRLHSRAALAASRQNRVPRASDPRANSNSNQRSGVVVNYIIHNHGGRVDAATNSTPNSASSCLPPPSQATGPSLACAIRPGDLRLQMASKHSSPPVNAPNLPADTSPTAEAAEPAPPNAQRPPTSKLRRDRQNVSTSGRSTT